MRPGANAGYWREKIASNVARDERTDQALTDAGRMIVRVWEHEPAPTAAERIDRIIGSKRHPC